MELVNFGHSLNPLVDKTTELWPHQYPRAASQDEWALDFSNASATTSQENKSQPLHNLIATITKSWTHKEPHPVLKAN